jgi:heterodisulfide reductase subunit A-like polyferredoxin
VGKHKKIGSVMVVGGGIAGIQASLELADSGYKVYLVESQTAIGGHMAQLDKTFPTNDCSMCTISPRLVAAGTHRNIEIITSGELSELSGRAGSFQAKVAIRPQFVDFEKCTGCGLCAENCPVAVRDEYNQLLCDRKAIFKLYPQAVPNKFAMTRLGTAPCYDGCPIRGNPSGYVALAGAGKYEEAFRSAAEKNPFPSICGRICEHPCEQNCNRANWDDPISIASVKRFLADWHEQFGEKVTVEQKQRFVEENGAKVAIVGAGPCGLSAALELRKTGYCVSVFEKQGVMGGMMSLGVPAYRLPEDVIQRDIQNILDYGIEVELNSPVKTEADIDRFFAEGFEAVFLSVGSHGSTKLGIPGEGLGNVSHGIEFLRDIRLGNRKSVKEKVIVIGGGNVAIDCARSAVRLGAGNVTLVCLEEPGDMPAYPWEIKWAEEEGVVICAGKATKRILESDGEFAALELLDVKRMAFVDGKLELETAPNTEEILPGDELLIAIGQKPDLGFLKADARIKLTPRGTILADEKTGMTSWKGVFAGGDVMRGASSVVEAIADGQRAAEAIDAYIRGEDFELQAEGRRVVEISTEELKSRKEKVLRRQQMPMISLERRTRTFEEVDLGFTEEMARKEAQRCLVCAVCSDCKRCSEVCEADAIVYDEVQKERTLDIGAVILAPGCEVYDAEQKAEYGYRRFPNVVSGLDYERILSASGPFGGHIKRLSDGREPNKIAFIQCVGSRETDNTYCSSVCCMYATKQAIVTKEHASEIECKIFVMDVRAFGKGFDEYYERARSKYGVHYVYTRPSAVKQNFRTHNLSLEFTEEGKDWREEEFDMVVLSCGLCAPKEAAKLGEVCEIELNRHKFAKSEDFAPTASSREGIYLAGVFEGPKDVPESVTQASGAAAKVMELLAEVRGTAVKAKTYPPERDVSAEGPRIGVFVCHCGSNIGGVVDCERIAKYARNLKNVVLATDLMYSCSPDGLQAIREKIDEHGLNRVVVASCTPRTHESLFQGTIRETGLNPYLFEMANIRDQCTWVHARFGDEAEDKALDLVRMAVGRARMIEPLTTQTYAPNRSALVVGGGVAGMTAALSIANQGFEVHLVEKSNKLGGNLSKIKSTVEGLKPRELLEKLQAQVMNHERIALHINSVVEQCKGFVGNFASRITCSEYPRPRTIEIEHGAAIVATGARESKPSQYLYGRNKNVLTQLQLEYFIEHYPSFAEGLAEVVMIQCVGSREPERMACSRVCCTEAIKNAILIKRANPKVNIAILYRDIRTYGFKEDYYNEARRLGVLFFRYDLKGKPMVCENGRGGLEVRVRDLNSRLDLVFSPEVLVLSAAMIPSEDNDKVGTAFKAPVTGEGFFLEAHMKLRPVDFASDGLFLCGTCHGPKFINESICQAQAAAARAVGILSKEVMEVSGVVSVVDPDKCAACLTCVRTCPYDVPTINGDGVAEIESVMCHGCGICASECPAKAIELMHYKDSQLIAKTRALFSEKGELVKNE